MEKAFKAMLIASLFLTGPVCDAQTFEVSDPAIALIENTVHFTYDILNSSRSDKFIVNISITDAEGRAIGANALSGDIGDGVSGGGGKVIRWDLGKDGIIMNSEIHVRIRAKLIPPPGAEVIAREEPAIVVESPDALSTSEIKQEESTVKKETTSAVESNSMNRGAVMIRSAALPGLGLTRVTGKPHWIKGVAGYGCIAGAVVLNRRAINTYEGIYDLTGYNEKDELLQESLKQDNISETLAYAAIGIWVADLVWTWIGTSDMKEKPFYGDLDGLSLKTNMDPLTGAPLIGVRYRF